jgi:hypothetical protein
MKFVCSLGFFLSVAVLCSAADYDPSPNPEAVVQVGKARFTVLTDHLVRMEWGGANDAATLAFVNRNLPTPKFTTSKDGNWTIIKTSAVEVLVCHTSMSPPCAPSRLSMLEILTHPELIYINHIWSPFAAQIIPPSCHAAVNQLWE